MISAEWTVTLDSYLQKRCADFATALVDAYQTGRNNASLAYSQNGIDRDPKRQAIAKEGEVALCLLCGGNPILDIEWRTSGPGCRQDYDYFNVRRDIYWDVKTALAGWRYLLWPSKKNAIYTTKQFDAIASMVNHGNGRLHWQGWITKREFFGRKLVAGRGSLLQEGTWYVPLASLSSPSAAPPMKSMSLAV